MQIIWMILIYMLAGILFGLVYILNFKVEQQPIWLGITILFWPVVILIDVVISLSKDSKKRVKQELESLGAKVVELQVSGGFHSPFMEPARERLKRIADNLNFKKAKIPIVSNFTADSHNDPEDIKDNLISQLISPVLWKNCVEFMIKKGVTEFVEVGPSKVLKGLMRKIDRRVKMLNVERAEDLT